MPVRGGAGTVGNYDTDGWTFKVMCRNIDEVDVIIKSNDVPRDSKSSYIIHCRIVSKDFTVFIFFAFVVH